MGGGGLIFLDRENGGVRILEHCQCIIITRSSQSTGNLSEQPLGGPSQLKNGRARHVDVSTKACDMHAAEDLQRNSEGWDR